MTRNKFRADDDANVVAGEAEETRFLRSATRILDAIRQSPDVLIKEPGRVSRLVKKAIKSIPLVGPAGTRAVRRAREFRARASKLGQLIRHLLKHPEQLRYLQGAYRARGHQGFREELAIQLPALRRRTLSGPEWFRQTRPTPRLLAEFRARRWGANTPKITVIMPVYNVREDWLRTAVESVMAQTYPLWELVCINDASPAPHVRKVLDELAGRDPRVRAIHLPRNRGVSAATNRGLAEADGEYVAFMDHDDFLEPHALHRVAEAILRDRPDMLYSDEVITGEDIDRIIQVAARSYFSYDYYLCHPYFTHLIVARTELARRVGGLDEAMGISQDVDYNLRLIEVCQSVCHVPDVLYRWRAHVGSLGHQKMDQVLALSRGALERHFARIGQVARIEDESYFNYRDIQFQHATPARVAILVPTRDRADRLRACITSLERTVDPSLADIVVINRASDRPDVRAYLADRGEKLRVVRHEGPSHSSAVINAGVAAICGLYSHYVFLDDGIEAIVPGWLEHMLGYGQRGDVGVVGALLIDEDEFVQHGGVVVGIGGTYDHALRGSPFWSGPSDRCRGHNGSLLASRDVSAVSDACMLTRADIFHGLSGFDEQLVVAFHDVDYCLRASAQGYKTILDAYAVLHHADDRILPLDSAVVNDGDIRLFRERYRDLIVGGDPFHSPMFSRFTAETRWSASAGCDRKSRPRTTRVVLPRPAGGCKFRRHDAEEADKIDRRPHVASHLLSNRGSSDLQGVLDD
jgi:GT2 family glycosyltransferase